MDSDQHNTLLEKHYISINTIILSRQDPITGLLPASTAKTAHGDYTDAWVRDNVYSILSVWGLALAYKKHNPTHVRYYLLSQSVVKLMRGLLEAMMRQSNRVETFKKTLNPTDALHAKYATATGVAVVGDDEWGHLQLDATSLYLLMSAQMIESGLHLIYTLDEVDFIQNLVHYISHTYCTPDYGIWERGNKINHGMTEINCSSVGMAKAALEALNGFNLFGNVEAQEGIIHVVPSDIARSRFTLQGLLPRESASKETDAALLSIIGYPAYAIEDKALVERTRTKILKKLSGRYGCKRFLLDGHQSALEDPSRLHYEPSELRQFDHIESEWPLFFTYLLLDALIRGDDEEVLHWREKLEPLFIDHEGERLLPELYLVPKESIEAEKEHPNSQLRIPNENIPLVWAQSLFSLSDMMMDGLLTPHDIDPLSRRTRIGFKRSVRPLVCTIAQNDTVKQQLLEHNIYSETLSELSPIQVMHASKLSQIHTFIGENEKLGLSGCPLVAARTITTARLHRLNHQDIVFLPYYFNPEGFYFGYDTPLLVNRFRSSLKFLSTHWDQSGEPILPFLVREDMLKNDHKEAIFELLNALQKGSCNGINIQAAPLHELLKNASIERIDTIDPLSLAKIEAQNTESFSLEYESAALNQDWAKVRIVAETSGKYDDRLEDVLLDIIIHQKRLAVGRAYSEHATFSKPLKNTDIITIIRESCGNNTAESVLTQEVMIHLGALIQSEPELFTNMLTLRTWYFVQLLVGQISRENALPMGDAYEHLLSLSPHEIYERIRVILQSFSQEVSQFNHQENLTASGISTLSHTHIHTPFAVQSDNWGQWRHHEGMISRLPQGFYKDVWYLLRQCNGLVIGDKYNLHSRIGSEITLESTAGEQSFVHKIDDLLQAIDASEYRQLNIEAIESLTQLFKHSPALHVNDDLILDVLIGHAVRIGWQHHHPHKHNYDEVRSQAWEMMYHCPPKKTAELFVDALIYLLAPQ